MILISHHRSTVHITSTILGLWDRAIANHGALRCEVPTLHDQGTPAHGTKVLCFLVCRPLVETSERSETTSVT